jgi:hypothetical protein
MRVDDKWVQSQLKQKEKRQDYAKGKTQFSGIHITLKNGNTKIIENKVPGQKELFEELWSTRKHVSWLTGAPLRQYEDEMDDEQCWHKHPLWYNLFHHVLNKKNYPKFRLLHDNIIFLTPQEHLSIHSESKELLIKKYGEDNMNRYYDLVEQLKSQYNGR